MATPESQEASGWRDTAERILSEHRLHGGLGYFLWSFFVGFVSWPIRYRVLVGWSYGKRAYEEGVRVLKGRPLKFSNGELVPQSHDVVTSFAAFFITVIGLTFLLIAVVRLYERWVGRRRERNNQ